MAKKTKSAGAPSKYKKEYEEQAYKLSLLGAIDTEMADFFNVSEKTFHNWKKRYPKLLQSIKKGKIVADAEVARSLYSRAVGAEWEEEQAFKLKCGTNQEKVEIVKVRKAAPPDTAAAFIWLQNRRREDWHRNPEPKQRPDDVLPDDYSETLKVDENGPERPIL